MRFRIPSEELKPVPKTQRIPGAHQSFRIPSEELKLPIQIHHIGENKGFRIPSEELKLRFQYAEEHS